MITISLDKIGKRFNREWIFRNLSYTINPGDKVVILGGNGSGKSTLLQVISGFVTPNEGHLLYSQSQSKTYSNDQHVSEKVDPEKIKDHLAFASPYIQLVEEFTAWELIEHIGGFKKFSNNFSVADVLNLAELAHAKHKLIKQYSSGMKQRLKLALAILSDTPVLLLDEPLSNLDKKAIEWYKQMMEKYSQEKTVIVCSNAISEEYFFCTKEINVMQYK